MYFIYILVIAVALLTILAGIALVLGASKTERVHSLWFLLAAVGEVIWAVSIAVFLSLGDGSVDYGVAPWLVLGIYVGALVMDAALLAYIAWRYKIGKVVSIFFVIAAGVLIVLLAYDPSILYSSIILKDTGNSVTVGLNAYYICYVAFFCLLNFVIFLFLTYKIRHDNNKKSKKGYLFFLIGLMATGVLSGIFDLILPLFRYDLIWVGPITIGLTILGFYFSILKYKIVSMNTRWLKLLSAIVIINGAFIAYLLIFHLVFSAMFKVPNPSYQVILLNFIMVAIVVALVPAIMEVGNMVKSLIMTKQVNLPYIVKKLSTIDPKKSNLREISGFLSEYMHFSYIGFLINGKFYIADGCKIPNDFLVHIEKLPIPAHGVWQNTTPLGENNLKNFEISHVAILAGASGEVLGQMVFGKPVSKTNLDSRDLVEISMIVSLMGTMLEDGSRGSSKKH